MARIAVVVRDYIGRVRVIAPLNSLDITLNDLHPPQNLIG